MRLKVHIPPAGKTKETNLEVQRWENEGGHLYDFTGAPENTPGLLYDGQQFEVLNSHLTREEGTLYQIVEIKPLNNRETK